MNRKIMNLCLMAALVCGLGLSVASCKDDDDDNSSESGTPEEQLAEQSNDFWAVVGQLVGTTNATDDYQSKTFEPIIGEAVEGNATVRRVLVNTMESAAERFESLVGLDEGTVTAETGSYTWKSDAVGTLTYTKSQDGQSLATVDVSIRQVPRLSQIVYMTPEQMGTNAGEDSWRNCYYHFGDVIKRKTDEGITEYWICVRPSFDPEGKKKSYWATVSPLPAKNIATYTASNGKTYTVPTKLGQDDKQMENLAEMLYAMHDPKKWEDNITDNPGGFFSSGIEIFQDFHRENIKYFSKKFWQRVDKGWLETKPEGKEDLYQAVFGIEKWTFNFEMGSFGLHLLYYGYKWKWSLSNSLSLYEQVFTHEGDGTKSNMHNMKKHTISHDVIDKRNGGHDIHVNVAGQYTEDHPYLNNDILKSSDNSQRFFGDNDDARHFIFRFATGEELAKLSGAAYDRRTKISGFEDVYVYTLKYGLDVNKRCEESDDIPNATNNEPQDIPAKVGALVGLDGKFYENKAKCEAAGTQPIAMVVYLSTDGHRVEKGKPWTGLALALSDEASVDGSGKFQWTVGDATTTSDLCTTCVGGGRRTDEGNSGDLETDYRSFVLDGWAMTKRMVQRDCFNHSHPAAEAAWSTANRPAGFSEWFMPSIGQWILALKGMGYERQYTSSYLFGSNNYKWNFKNNGKWLWEEAGVTEAALKTDYATSTQHGGFSNEIYIFDGGRSFTNAQKDYSKYRVRRMIAFGDGATIDPQTFPQPIDPRPGAIITEYGYFFANMDDLKFYLKESNAKAMVVYYSKTKRVEEGSSYNGLAIGLKDHLASEWCTYKNAASHECTIAVGGAADYAKAISGDAICELLAQDKNGHEHPAAERSRENSSNISNGFLPSAGQWILAKQGLGYTWSTDGVGHFNTAGKWPWPEAGLAQYATADVAEYWTCTEQKDGDAYKVLAVSPNGVSFKLHDKTDKLLVRPFFAFGHWGTED